MRLSLFKVVFGLLAVITVITFLFALNGYPLFVVDSGCFMPVSYFIEHGHQLINPFYDAGIDRVGHKFLFYPPLFPWTVAFITRLLPLHINALFITLTIIDDLTVWVLFISLYLYVKRKRFEASLNAYFFFCLLGIAVFAFQGISSGRPEILSRLLISCFLLNNIAWNRSIKHPINGLIVGLALITSPISGIYLVLINAAYLTYSNHFKWQPVVATAIGGVAILIVFVMLYPYPVSDLINGMRVHSANVIFNRSGSDVAKTFIGSHVTAVATPLGIVPFIVVGVYMYAYLLHRKFYFTLLFMAVLTAAVAYFSFWKDMQMAYNLYVLSPLALFFIAVVFVRNYRKKFLFSYLNFFLMIVLFINTTGFIRKTVVFFKVKDQLVAPAAFRQQLAGMLKQTKTAEKVVVSNGLWPYALSDYKKVVLFRTGEMDFIKNDPAVKYMLIQQSNSGLTKPPAFPGFRLIKNGFNINNIKLWKLQLGNTYPGYQTAIYERE